jgi:hypothetical protein
VHECTATKLKQHLLRVRVRASSKPQLKNAHFTTQYMPDAGDFRCFATPNNAFATAMVMFVTARMCACILQLGCKKKLHSANHLVRRHHPYQKLRSNEPKILQMHLCVCN